MFVHFSSKLCVRVARLMSWWNKVTLNCSPVMLKCTGEIHLADYYVLFQAFCYCIKSRDTLLTKDKYKGSRRNVCSRFFISRFPTIRNNSDDVGPPKQPKRHRSKRRRRRERKVARNRKGSPPWWRLKRRSFRLTRLKLSTTKCQRFVVVLVGWEIY